MTEEKNTNEILSEEELDEEFFVDAFKELKEKEQITNDFEKMDLKENLLRGIYGYGFEKPSEIQSKAIVPITQEKDLIAQAQSGTGKTGAFVIGSLQLVDPSIKSCQVIIVTHTRELGRQIFTVVNHLNKYLQYNVVECIGGTNMSDNCKKLCKNVQFIVGTPGRIIDIINREIIDLSKMKVVILDEADELLSKGFRSQLKEIIKLTSSLCKNLQICLFSATMNKNVLDLSKEFLINPMKILMKNEEVLLNGIRQYKLTLKEKNKLSILESLFSKYKIGKTIIFSNTKKKAEWLRDKLQEKDYTISTIHSDMNSVERAQVLKDFSANTRILISTDLLARGIDIQHISLVVNFDFPLSVENYVHRIGRSGRYGRKGLAISFVTEDNFPYIKNIEQTLKIKIYEMPKNLEIDFNLN